MSDNTISYTLMPEPNISYLSHYTGVPVISEPLSGSTMGLMMILSTFQYQSPSLNPAYSNALNQAGKAAFIESGGQAMQDKLKNYGTDKGKETLQELGMDSEVAVLLGSAKVIRDRQINVRGPNLGFVKTHLTIGQDHGSFGLGWDWK
jgi:hypothetical protein